jgi:hypothetical protein
MFANRVFYNELNLEQQNILLVATIQTSSWNKGKLSMQRSKLVGSIDAQLQPMYWFNHHWTEPSYSYHLVIYYLGMVGIRALLLPLSNSSTRSKYFRKHVVSCGKLKSQEHWLSALIVDCIW